MNDHADAVPPFEVAYYIDQCWCDAYGLYLKGWLHCHQHRLDALTVHVGPDSARVVDFHDRPDLLNFFADHPHVVHSGFEVYVACRPGVPVGFEVATKAGRRTLAVELPRRELPPPLKQPGKPWAPGGPPFFLDFIDMVNDRHLSILEIGSRIVGGASVDFRRNFPGAGNYIGFDIHPAPGVDVVGDAHALSSLVGEGAVDAVFSLSVLEHLAMPWIVAAEINRVLKPGGHVFHSAPQAWPIHEYPNDFWRFSDHGLQILFGPFFGFEVVEATMINPVQLYPEHREGPHLQLPFNPGFGNACILSRKVAELPDSVLTSFDRGLTGLAERSRQYPRRP
ncbi:MAG TPA: class I SAM-dependent methyltransferase [Aliidongia sp.]|uniref:class I SAM-dependent methyltransferase n=1 Tax=Aliidongia sp. TaxID=1914230 RepID=UPI002DDD20A4|nr:class I SAM-dependent methyltransferase [Aliidongia sp.]HEV2676078.1 class I SAM-dependent methyltransferase [Aliidongia sp.]